MSEVAVHRIDLTSHIINLIESTEKRINWLEIDMEDQRRVIKKATEAYSRHEEELQKCLQELEKYKQVLQDTSCMFVTTLS